LSSEFVDLLAAETVTVFVATAAAGSSTVDLVEVVVLLTVV
jgi:hypothetical protein